MVVYEFNYRGHKINYTVDFWGREKVLVDDKLLTKITSWFKTVESVDFEVNTDGDVEKLKLTRRMLSQADTQSVVILSNEKKIIEKQSKVFLNWGGSLSNSVDSFQKEDFTTC